MGSARSKFKLDSIFDCRYLIKLKQRHWIIEVKFNPEFDNSQLWQKPPMKLILQNTFNHFSKNSICMSEKRTIMEKKMHQNENNNDFDYFLVFQKEPIKQQSLRLLLLNSLLKSSIYIIIEISQKSMPIFSLILKARTQNVEAIKIVEENIWLAKIKCTGCNQMFPKEVSINRMEEVQMEKQHGAANFSAKCKNCERKGYITILKTSKYEARPDENGLVKASIAEFECRGVEIMEIDMGEYFNVEVKDSGTIFEKADFTDLWCEYDDKISAVAQVEEPKLEVVRSREK